VSPSSAAEPVLRRRPRVRPLIRRLAGLVSMVVVFAACGGDDSGAPGPTDAGAPGASCEPRLPSPWAPRWRPPRAVLNACTDAQIETEFMLCGSQSTYSAACAAFERDASNAACLRCLYTTEDEEAYGPLIYLRNRVVRVNVEGCIALADGQLGASGCGAQLHGLIACSDAACMTNCAAYDDFNQCAKRAKDGVCSPYRLSSACDDVDIYAACVDFGNFDEAYLLVTKLFCGAGFPGGGDAGIGDAGPDDAARPIGWQGRSLGAPPPTRSLSIDPQRLWREIGVGKRVQEGVAR